MYTANSNRYNSMKYNYCGMSGLQLPQISLGLWHNFGGVDTLENSRDMVKKAFDLGITHFDLANNYGPPPGSAEETFGYILKNDLSPFRDEIIISTKAGYYMWPGPYGEFGSRKYLISSLDQSLKRMGLDYVDIFYSHRFDPNTPLEETIGTLADILNSGKALYVGISNYSAEDTLKAEEILNSKGRHCLIHQPKYNMFERWIENGLTNVLREKGIGSIPFSPLAQGLLTDKYLDGIPQNSRASKPHGFLKPEHLTEEKISKVKKLNEIAINRGQKLSQLALNWILRLDEVTSALIGASSIKQIEEAVESINAPKLTADELTNIENILSE
ncbi:MAG: L-glyceraldehyde 3-phosphate reductase [Ignavibacteriales bacterium]|nr:L-glyceraldehyde 3-phosphate reductase [Ignavibacteriales bacterium]MCB9260536.1 L-glyceraldehyde 3-phosphate reductase [Ignavibacteriales bacterium]